MNLVLAHGFLGFERRFGVDYFHGVAEWLGDSFAALPLKVLVTEVKPLARIQERGQAMRRQILDALSDGRLDRAEKVHLVAHSMGGLDARYCVSPANPENIAAQVASVSTISTPHRGSPLADVVTAGWNPGSLGPRLDPLLNAGLGILDLTTQGAACFNRDYPDHPAVRYFSYAGRGRDGAWPTSMVLLPAYYLLKRLCGGANDGLVSLDSAAWGESPEPPWPADHADEIGHDLNAAGRSNLEFDHLARYGAIVERLKRITSEDTESTEAFKEENS